MGGHDGGELASAAVVDTFANAWDNNTEPWELFTLQEWLTEANRNVYDIASGRAGTTLTMLTNVLHQNKEQLVVANVGDSRTYRYRANDEAFIQRLEPLSSGRNDPTASSVPRLATRRNVHPCRGSALRLCWRGPP